MNLTVKHQKHHNIHHFAIFKLVTFKSLVAFIRFQFRKKQNMLTVVVASSLIFSMFYSCELIHFSDLVIITQKSSLSEHF